MLGHGPAGDGAHAATVRAIKREEEFTGEALTKAEKTGVFGKGAATGKNAEAKRVFKTFLHLLR